MDGMATHADRLGQWMGLRTIREEKVGLGVVGRLLHEWSGTHS